MALWALSISRRAYPPVHIHEMYHTARLFTIQIFFLFNQIASPERAMDLARLKRQYRKPSSLHFQPFYLIRLIASARPRGCPHFSCCWTS